MGTISLKQIKQGVGLYSRMNAIVFNTDKKKTTRYPDEVPDSQIDVDIETTTKSAFHRRRPNGKPFIAFSCISVVAGHN